jgi:hypothetical protein
MGIRCAATWTGWVCALLGCDAPAPPTPPAPTVQSTPAAPATVQRAASPTTALMVVRLTLAGEVHVGAVRPKSIPWREPLVPYSPPAGLATGTAAADDVRPGAQTPRPLDALPDTAHHHLAVVVRIPGRPPLARALLLDAPGHTRGDVIDPWTGGGAVWRLPWFGPATTYEVVRMSPAPAVLARWPER